MINRIFTRLHLPGFVEIVLGVFLVIVLITRYSADPQTQNKYLLEYIIAYQPLFILVTIFLFLVAARLIAGKPKNYTNTFYHLLKKINGKSTDR